MRGGRGGRKTTPLPRMVFTADIPNDFLTKFPARRFAEPGAASRSRVGSALFDTGGVLEVSRWRQPPEPMIEDRAPEGRWRFRRPSGTESSLTFHRWLTPPANFRGPFGTGCLPYRAKFRTRSSEGDRAAGSTAPTDLCSTTQFQKFARTAHAHTRAAAGGSGAAVAATQV